MALADISIIKTRSHRRDFSTEQARKDPQKLLSQWIDKTASGAFSDTFLEVFDFKKLPAFDVVESHLTFTLTGNISDQKALKLRSVAPNPPALK